MAQEDRDFSGGAFFLVLILTGNLLFAIIWGFIWPLFD